MLDKKVRNRAEQLISVLFDKLRQEAQGEVTRKSVELDMRGLVHGGAAVAAIHTICVEQVEKRADVVWSVLQRVMTTVGTVYSDTLAQDLKLFVEHYVPGSLWELPGFYAQMGGQALYDHQFRAALLVARAQALQIAHAEINLYVDGLRQRAQKASAAVANERDQKFGILFSPKQAELDFDEWKSRLSSGEASIAFLYLDIDNFKALNTRHTETVVDKTILPDVLRLLADLVNQRGEGYQQGGDEFVLILPNHDEAEAVAFAEKVRSRIASRQFQVGDKTETLTISGGVALWPKHGATYDAVLLKANQAKQIAKQTRDVIILAE
jgi:diguanylate cyclase (GGDEF)-like protein